MVDLNMEYRNLPGKAGGFYVNGKKYVSEAVLAAERKRTEALREGVGRVIDHSGHAILTPYEEQFRRLKDNIMEVLDLHDEGGTTLMDRLAGENGVSK